MPISTIAESPLESTAWYAWETETSESNWLLTYVDMLSVVLAMLVVLLGHMAVQHIQVEVGSEPQVKVEATVASPAPPVERSTSDLMPVVTEKTAPAPGHQLISAIEDQFHDEVKVIERDTGISLEIADAILFESGSAVLLPGATPVLSRLAAILQSIGEVDVAVEGHTDNRPIHAGRYQSNWDLAAARANAVTSFLLSQGFVPQRLRSVSYADTHPVADNDTAEGRAENRRVNIRVDYL